MSWFCPLFLWFLYQLDLYMSCLLHSINHNFAEFLDRSVRYDYLLWLHIRWILNASPIKADYFNVCHFLILYKTFVHSEVHVYHFYTCAWIKLITINIFHSILYIDILSLLMVRSYQRIILVLQPGNDMDDFWDKAMTIVFITVSILISIQIFIVFKQLFACLSMMSPFCYIFEYSPRKFIYLMRN